MVLWPPLFVPFAKGCYGDQIKEYAVDKACGTHGSKYKCADGFGGKIWRNKGNRVGDQDIDGVALERIWEKSEGYGLDLSGLRVEPMAGCCEHGNGPAGYIKRQRNSFEL